MVSFESKLERMTATTQRDVVGKLVGVLDFV